MTPEQHSIPPQDTSPAPRPKRRRSMRATTAIAAALMLAGISGVAGCSAVAAAMQATDSDASDSAESASASATAASTSTLWDTSQVHTIDLTYDADDYEVLIAAYLDSGSKEWISADVTIDGTTYQNVGLKLKGNSSLRSLSTSEDATLSSANPQDLPWIIRLDKYVDGQNHEGATELVVRGNSSETSLNEALALDLLRESGLATEQATAVRFSADGSDASLRLVIENPDDDWMERELGDGLLYKADASGDYSYRGDDESSYTDVFDQQGGDDDLTPLISFLQWINESDNDTFAADLDEHLDVQSFATYLAFQELVQNSDDIDGPGNNSYLYYDPDTTQMTVVNWDLNLAFGASPGGGMGGGFGGGGGEDADTDGAGFGGGMPPGGQDRTTDSDAGTDGGFAPGGAGPAGTADDTDDADGTTRAGGNAGGGMGSMGGSNILVERFMDVPEFAALVDAASASLQDNLVDSGVAQELLDTRTQTLLDDASDLVDAATIQEESDALSATLGK
ncbi:CotH kinase family protein [Leucobacter musarum]|uniref:CotH kinase family protein n=1 Tax=Leucobacter musarum TaxID=1930747 RepID=UPI0006A7616C|nr:CotH kinase family protein [Leucobacter musarum]